MTEPQQGEDATEAGWSYRPMGWGQGYGSMFAPALATHRGRMWVLFLRTLSNSLYYAEGTAREQWKTPQVFYRGVSTRTAPALAEWQDSLHAVISEDTFEPHELVHYQYIDEQDRWIPHSSLRNHSSRPVALGVCRDRLFCAFASTNNDELMYTIWDPQQGWSTARTCNRERTYAQPALFTLGARFYLLFTSANDNKDVLQLVFDPTDGSWSRYNPWPAEQANSGVSTASEVDRVFMGFRRKGGDELLVSTFTDGRWSGNEQIGKRSWTTPALAVHGGLLNCLYADASDHRELWWAQRPPYSTIDLADWMARIPDGTLLSQLSIPGTHDSCAVSVVPFVGCQKLSITEQLMGGVRFLDLRCGLVRDTLFMYHGDYALDPPFGLKLRDVLNEIYTWMDKHPKEIVIASIKEDHDPVDPVTTFEAAVRNLIEEEAGRWLLTDAPPKLDSATRHRLVMLRRYRAIADFDKIGIDVTAWQDDSPSFTILTPGGVKFSVQDQYLATGWNLELMVRNKWSVVEPLMNQAAAPSADPERWYLNFSSAVSVGPFFAQPYDIAVGVWIPGTSYTPGVNEFLRDKVADPATKRYGTILMDFPERPHPDMIHSIVMSNF